MVESFIVNQRQWEGPSLLSHVCVPEPIPSLPLGIYCLELNTSPVAPRGTCLRLRLPTFYGFGSANHFKLSVHVLLVHVHHFVHLKQFISRHIRRGSDITTFHQLPTEVGVGAEGRERGRKDEERNKWKVTERDS